MRRLYQPDAIRSRSSCPLSRFLWILKIDFQSGPFYVARRRRCNRNGGSQHETEWRLQFRLTSTAARIPISCCLMALLNISARDAPASKSPRGEMARCSRQRAKIVESPSLRKSAPIFIARSVTTMFEAIESSRWLRLQTPSGSGISSPSNPHPDRHYIALPGSRQIFANVSSCASVLNPRSLKCVVKTTFAVAQLPTRYGPATCHFVSLKSAL